MSEENNILKRKTDLLLSIEEEIKSIVNDKMGRDFSDFVNDMQRVLREDQVIALFGKGGLDLFKDYQKVNRHVGSK